VTDVHWQVVAYVFVSIVLWMVAAQLNRRKSETAWGRHLSEGWVASVLRFLYYIGLPYATLVLGVMPARYLGLTGLNQLQVSNLPQMRDAIALVILDWVGNLDTALALTLTMLTVLSITWLGYKHFERGMPSGDEGHSLSKNPSIIHILYQAIHWSFYRGAVWLLTGDLYLGIIGGILLVVGEWLLAPGWVNKVRHPLSVEEPLLEASLLIAVSAIFFFVPNLWLLVPIHWLLAAACRWMVSSTTPLRRKSTSS
jgi:hypothetical protein